MLPERVATPLSLLGLPLFFLLASSGSSSSPSSPPELLRRAPRAPRGRQQLQQLERARAQAARGGREEGSQRWLALARGWAEGQANPQAAAWQAPLTPAWEVVPPKPRGETWYLSPMCCAPSRAP